MSSCEKFRATMVDDTQQYIRKVAMAAGAFYGSLAFGFALCVWGDSPFWSIAVACVVFPAGAWLMRTRGSEAPFTWKKDWWGILCGFGAGGALLAREYSLGLAFAVLWVIAGVRGEIRGARERLVNTGNVANIQASHLSRNADHQREGHV